MTVLTGIRVLELASEPIALAGKLLADMGAEVILVEPPGGCSTRRYPPFVDDQFGPDRSLYFMHYNTSKRSLVIDLEQAAGVSQFRELLSSADILIEAEPLQRLSKMGLSATELENLNPELIYAAMTSYGQDDPRSALPFTDLTVLAGGGPVWNCGYDDHTLPPVRGAGNQGFNTGCHFVVMSVLTAMLERGLSGKGQFIDVNMHAAANVTTEAGSYSWLVNQSTVMRQTGRHAATGPTMETQMLCADGRYANTGVPPRFPAEFARLSKWLKQLGLDSELPESVFLEMGAEWEGPFDLSLIGKDDTITAIFASGRQALQLIASSVSAEAFFLGCQKAGLSVGVINSPEEAYENEHFRARGFQVEVEHPELKRSFRYPGAPWHFEKTPWRISNPAPALDEFSREPGAG